MNKSTPYKYEINCKIKSTELIKKIQITLIFILVNGCLNLSFAQDNSDKRRTDYQKLNKKEIKRFFKLETKTHKLGSVTFTKYDDLANRIIKTTYDTENGVLVFDSENIYKYNENDSLIYESQYSEIPSAEYPEFREDKFNCFKEYCLQTRLFNGEVQDSIFTTFNKNQKNLVESEIEVTMTSRSKFKIPRDKTTTYYTYDDQGNVINKKTNASRYEKEYSYEYVNGKLKKEYFKADHFTSKKVYNKKGDLMELEVSYPQESLDKYQSIFIYNKDGWRIQKDSYKNGKLTNSYKYINDKKGREIIHNEGEENSIYYYEYDNKDRVISKISLFFRDDKPKEIKTYIAVPAQLNTY